MTQPFLARSCTTTIPSPTNLLDAVCKLIFQSPFGVIMMLLPVPQHQVEFISECTVHMYMNSIQVRMYIHKHLSDYLCMYTYVSTYVCLYVRMYVKQFMIVRTYVLMQGLIQDLERGGGGVAGCGAIQIHM